VEIELPPLQAFRFRISLKRAKGETKT